MKNKTPGNSKGRVKPQHFQCLSSTNALSVNRNRVKKLAIILILVATVLTSVGQDKKNAIRFDGIYQTVPEIDTVDKDTTWNYLRFYKDGTIISVAASGTIEDIAAWFTLSPTEVKTAWQQNPSKGQYKVTGNRIHFTTTSKQGSIAYKGVIVNGSKLKLHFRGAITGTRGTEIYYFVKAVLN